MSPQFVQRKAQRVDQGNCRQRRHLNNGAVHIYIYKRADVDSKRQGQGSRTWCPYRLVICSNGANFSWPMGLHATMLSQAHAWRCCNVYLSTDRVCVCESVMCATALNVLQNSVCVCVCVCVPPCCTETAVAFTAPSS